MTRLSKEQNRIGKKLTDGAIIRDDLSGYRLGGRTIRRATIDALIRSGWAVHARIEAISGLRVSDSVIVAAPGRSTVTRVLEYSDGTYGVVGRVFSPRNHH